MLLHTTADALPFLQERVAMSYAAPTGPGDGDPPPIGDHGDDDVDDGGDDEDDEEPLRVRRANFLHCSTTPVNLL